MIVLPHGPLARDIQVFCMQHRRLLAVFAHDEHRIRELHGREGLPKRSDRPKPRRIVLADELQELCNAISSFV